MSQSLSLKQQIAKWVALGGGSGLFPVAPGTAGTLAAIPLYWALIQLPMWGYVLGVVLTIFIGIWACQVYSDVLGVHDHGSIVWDEVAGYLLTMAVVPFDWMLVLAGFFLFRLFDIWKPWPIRRLDKNVEGGFGIMLDDIVAGIYAAACLFWLSPYILSF